MSDVTALVGALVGNTRPAGAPVPRQGHRLLWHQAAWQGELEVAQHVFASLHLESIAPGEVTPDELMETARSLLRGPGSMPGCAALELRYLLTPTHGGVPRIDLFVTVKAYVDDGGIHALDAALSAIEAALPTTFATRRIQTPEPSAWPTTGSDVVEIRRNEIVLEPVYDYVPADFFYLVDHASGSGRNWRSFWQGRHQVDRPMEISVLFKATDLSFDEQSACAAVVSSLQRLSESHVEPDLLGNDVHYPADANARLAYESWDELLRKLQPGSFLTRVAVRGWLNDTVPLATRLVAALGAENGGGALYIAGTETASEHRSASESFEWLEVYPWGGIELWRQEHNEYAPHSLRRFAYLHGLDDAASLAILPVSDDRGAPGFAVGRRNSPRRGSWESGKADIELGTYLHHGQAAGVAGVSLADVNRHVAVTGSPGSGKTTTVLTLLVRLWCEHRIPFMVIEPTKREYRSLLDTPGVDDLMVIPIGREEICSLRLNPLEPPAGVRCENHISSLLAMFKLALPLFAPLPQLLEEAIEATYSAAGWHFDSVVGDGLPVPTIRDLENHFRIVFDRAGYVGEAANLGAALRVRLASLTRGSKGRLLDTLESDDFEHLMNRPVVIELEDISDADDKAIIAALLLDRIRSSAISRSQRGALRHVTVLEEAHRLLSRSAGSSEDGESARQGAVDAFCNAIAELRSTGEGFVVSTQSPNRLAEAALANVGTRILHRMESARDREAMQDDLDLSEEDRPLAARLGRGEAFLRTPSMDDAELISTVPPRGVDSSRMTPDEQIAVAMSEFSEASRQRLPLPLCTREVCSEGCSSSRRRNGESVAVRLFEPALDQWESATSETSAIESVSRVIIRSGLATVPDRFCVAAHLAARRAAFASTDLDRTRSRIREQLDRIEADERKDQRES